VSDAAQDGSISQMLKIEVCEDQVERQVPFAHRGDKSRLDEILRPRVGRGQEEYPRTCGYSGLRWLT
jgi:hypothetical protein